MKAFSSTKALFAVAALVALVGSMTVLTTTEAAPLNNVNIRAAAQEPQHNEAMANLNEVPHHLRKRQATNTAHPTSAAPKPPATHAGTTTAAPKPPAKTTAAAHTTTKLGATVTNGAGLPTGSGTGAAPSASLPPGSGGTGDSGVPTKVSTKVFIGLGTVGGFFVFALGGLAFCRHRKKKNLASALLQQTAQFNNNNPYAKLPEPAASPKESLPMTPTKPLGTYNVVATYTAALPDEIEIALGDSVTILQEYDDGWCLGVNNSRGNVKGVFPRHCVEMGPYEGSQHGTPGGPHYPPSPSFKAAVNKRMSSIAPQGGWNDGYHGAPPQPSPQYLGPNQGPPYQGGGGGYQGGSPQPNQGPPHQGGGGGGFYNGGGY
ncbi:hypothetical protein BGZ99_005748 [Dissophora globulifera]|uniref:SH3 domain-containing protein n=1 Tax=Dissophora globulifera TaxID=979702 RepID=A0A9P6RE18_9FUNG|nr:hypothetical protein BGZ99_005748 [Dissophora globulifera]